MRKFPKRQEGPPFPLLGVIRRCKRTLREDKTSLPRWVVNVLSQIRGSPCRTFESHRNAFVATPKASSPIVQNG